MFASGRTGCGSGRGGGRIDVARDEVLWSCQARLSGGARDSGIGVWVSGLIVCHLSLARRHYSPVRDGRHCALSISAPTQKNVVAAGSARTDELSRNKSKHFTALNLEATHVSRSRSEAITATRNIWRN